MSDWLINTDIFNGYPYPFPPSTILPMMSLPTASSWFETTSGTSLSGNISATVGKTIVAVVTTRSKTTLSPDWDIIDKALSFSNSSQNLYVLTKVAQNIDETFTVSQTAAGRIYIQLLAFPSVITFETIWSYQSLDDTVTVLSPPDKNSLKNCILWALSANLWVASTPYGKWQTAPNDIQRYSAPTDVQDRQGVFIDVGTGAVSRTFPLVSTSGAACLMFKITSDEELENPPSGSDYDIPIEFLTTPFYYRNSPRFMWSISSEVNNGYPYFFVLEFHPPYHLPVVQKMELNMVQGYVGASSDLIVTLSGWKYIHDNDILQISFRNSSDEAVYTDDVILYDGQTNPLSITIPGNFLEIITDGLYKVQAKVFRAVDNVSSGTLSIDYLITAFPSLSVIAMIPNELFKPITTENNTVSLRYKINGDGIEQITNTFKLAGFSVSKTAYRNEMLVIESENRTSTIYDATINFTVTDPDFKLVSFKFKFGLYNASTEVDYRLDGVTVQKGTYPMGGWVEYVAPTPIALSPGTHSIRLYNSPSYWYLYSTTVKPVVPGMEITSTTVYAMEMSYVISTSGVGGERTAIITVDDTINPGVYPLLVDSSADLAGYGAYAFSRTVADVLEVLETAVFDPDIGAVGLSKSGRYAGCETDVAVTVSELDNILAGDAIKICLKNGTTTLYEHTSTLAINATSYSHTISEAKFVGLGAGAYSVTAEVSRGGFAKEVQAVYRVLAKPTIEFLSITPDTVQLPITSAMTITSSWKASGEGINSVQGTVNIVDTVCSASINTTSLNFNAVFPNITALAAEFHSLAANLTVTSTEYGSVIINTTKNDILEVLAAIPDPEIGGVALSIGGRYVGSETDVTANVSDLDHVLSGDILNLRLCQGSAGSSGGTVFYEHSENLTAGASGYSHIIPQASFVGLSAGTYTVKAVIKRGSFTTNEAEVTYRAVAKPTVKLISVTPERIQLPIITPITITAALEIAGEGVAEVTGTVSLDETGYSASVNTSGLNISAAFPNITDLNARGYFIAVSLTVKSNLYGTAAVNAVFENVLRVLDIIIPKDLRSGVLYVYNSFELAAILRNYVSFKWIRRYNKIGEFLLQLENTPRNVDLIHSGNIITKDNDDEAGFIEDITITDKIEVKGMFLTKMLTYRICKLTSETTVDLQSTANQLIRSNFIDTTANRVIPDFRIADYSIAPQNVTAKIENASVAQWLENKDAGFKVKFNTIENKFDFIMYDGRHSEAVFCESYRNITDQQYYEQTANTKNVCYVEGEEQQIHEVGSAQGLARREAYAKAGKYDPVEYGNVYLKQNKPVESLDVKIINPYSPFEYKTDYDVGDIVTITSEDYRVEITKNILEITEFFDKTGFHLYIVFGDIPRDLLMELQDKDSRLEALENAPEPKLSEEVIENLKDLIIPEIVDEVFDLLEFPPLPDYLSEENLRETIGRIVDEKLEGYQFSGGGDGIHVIIDHLPVTQAEIDTFPLNAEVLVYNPDNPYVPSG